VSTDTDKKRKYLTSLYPGYSWHERVANMSPEQVVAVYLRFQRDGFPRQEPKLNQDLKLEEPKKQNKSDDDQGKLF
jgi:hypothetical protein